MADPVAYFTLQELIDDMGEETFMAVFDDHGSQSIVVVGESTQVRTCVTKAHAFVKSWLVSINNGALLATNATPSLMSDLVKCAALEVAKCYAFRRRPEYVKTYGAFPGGPMWKDAIEMLERIQAGTQRIASDDHPAATEPTQGGTIEEDGPKAIVTTDPTDRPEYGDW
jgi:hypothetical protein